METSERPQRRLAVLVVALGFWSFLIPTASAQSYIFGRADFPTGSSPVSIATGDFNGDGRLDVVVADFGNGHDTNTISVLLGRPDGTLAPKVDYPTGQGPISVAVGDFNGDGKLDLVVVNVNSDTVSIFLGNGDGTFQARVDYATGAEPLWVTTGDFNGDGKLDLAVVNESDNTVSILLGNGDGTFQPKVDYGTDRFPLSVTTGDFNGDGKLDLAVVVGGGIAILLGKGDGTFQPEHTFNVTLPSGASTPVQIIASDFNGDRKLDLAIAAGDVFVLLGTGDGTFSTAVDYTINGSAQGVTAVDLDADGRLDLVAATGITISVLAGNGDGTFQSAVYYSVAAGAQAISTGDFNGDGRLDVATATLSSVVSILLGNGDGTFQTHADFPTGGGPWAVTASDLNGDGKLDLAVANLSGSVSVLLGNGNGTFQTHVDYATASGSEAVVAADFNGDGHPDLAVANNGAGTVSVLLGNGDGTFRTHVDYATQPLPPTSPGPTSLASGDFNGDGKLDLAVGNAATDAVAVLLGNGDGTFRPFISSSVGNLTAPVSVVAGDFNRDGKLDVATANMNGATVSVLLGNGDGTFQAPVAYPVGSAPQSITIGDFNGDGKLDLAVAVSAEPYRGDFIAVLLGNGDGTFQAAVDYPTANFVTSVKAGDVNGDGKLDLVASDLGIGDISILLGNGDGTFQPYRANLIGFVLRGVTTGDFSGNGGVGVAVGSTFTGLNAISILNAVPVIGLFPTNLSFLGQAVGKTSAAETVTVSNPSSTPLKVTGVSVTANFAETNDCGTVPVGGHCTINVTFTAPAKGVQTGVLTVTDDAPGGSQVVALTGSAGPLATLSPTSLTFQTQVLGTVSAAQKVTLSNPGSDALSITSITTKGDFGEANTCGTSVAAGSNCTVSVTFAPTAPGVRTGSLVIADNAPGSPQTVNLTGTATAPVVQLSPANLSFPGQLMGATSAALSVTLSNQSGAPLTITNLAASGDFAIAAAGTTCSTTTMPPPSTCTIAVTFTPTATGTRNGALTITDNAANSPQKVQLTGSGEDFAISAATGFSTSATVMAGLSTTYNLNVVPAGGFNSTVMLACSGAPPGASCSVVPGSVTPSGPAAAPITVLVATLARSILPPSPRGGLRWPGGLRGLPLAAWWIMLGMVALLVSFRRRDARRRVSSAAARLAIVLATFVVFWTACGGGGGTPGTPAGTYTLTITGTSTSGSVTLKHSVTLTLNVN